MTEDPIYLPKWYRFFPTIQEAVDFAFDQGEDPETVVAYACDIGQAYTPDIIGYIEESWYDQYEDADAYDLLVSQKVVDLVDKLQKLLEEEAPVMWTPRSERVQLPAANRP